MVKHNHNASTPVPVEPDESRVPAGSWLPAVGVFALAIAVRAWLLFSTGLVPQMDGAYYLVQARSLLQTGEVFYSGDLPLTFWVQAAMSWPFHALGMPMDSAVMLGVKLADAVLPALVVFPLWAVFRRASRTAAWRPLAGAIVLALAVLSTTPVRMVGDFQKNALGMVWVACVVWAAYSAAEERSWPRALLGVAFLGLAGLTHPGAFGVALLFSLTFVAAVGLSGTTRRGRMTRLAIALGATAAILGVAFLLQDSSVGRVIDAFKTPLELVSTRGLMMVMRSSQGTVPGIVNVAAATAAALAAGWMVVTRWRELPIADHALAFAGIATALVVGSPLLVGTDGLRLQLLAYFPTTVLALWIVARARTRVSTAVVAGTAAALMLTATPGVARRASLPVVNEAALSEMRTLAEQIAEPSTTLVVAQHGTEYWFAWATGVDTVQIPGATESLTDDYDTVLRLVGGGGPVDTQRGYALVPFVATEVPPIDTAPQPGERSTQPALPRPPRQRP